MKLRSLSMTQNNSSIRFFSDANRSGQPEYDTIGGAIRGATGQKTYRASVEASAQLSGSVVESVAWSDQVVQFHLSGLRSIRILCDHGRIDWSVDRVAEDYVRAESAGERKLLLERENGIVVSWDRADIIEQRVGRTFVRFQHSDGVCFFSVRGLPVLLFRVLFKVEGSVPFLRWLNVE